MRTLLLALGSAGFACAQDPAAGRAVERIPVIFDTDIGDDIDDTWALALILASPELDLKLVVTDSHDTEGKAKIVAKFLQSAERSDIPIGIGRKMSDKAGAQYPWAKDFDLSAHKGPVHKDGIQALIDVIMKSERQVTLIAVGPAPNIEEALKREPRIAQKARLSVMGGSVDRGYGGKPTPHAEYNVKDCPSATAAMYAAGWDVIVAPLDTAGTIKLTGERYQKILNSQRPSTKALIESYRIWSKNHKAYKADKESSWLYDTVAVYLAFRTDTIELEEVKLMVTPDGFTKRDEKGHKVRAALKWKDMDGFADFLVERLAGP